MPMGSPRGTVRDGEPWAGSASGQGKDQGSLPHPGGGKERSRAGAGLLLPRVRWPQLWEVEQQAGGRSGTAAHEEAPGRQRWDSQHSLSQQLQTFAGGGRTRSRSSQSRMDLSQDLEILSE